MKGQWSLIVGIVVALLIAVFAVINMEVVTVNYLIGTAEWPLVIVIISSVLMGALVVGAVGLYGLYKLKGQLKQLTSELEESKLKGKAHLTSKEKESSVQNEKTM